MPSTTTTEKPYTLGELTAALATVKEHALDLANGAYRIVHEAEAAEERIIAWRNTPSRAG